MDNIANMVAECKNCNEPISNKFCGNCGQPVQLKRVDGHYLLHEVQHVLHFEKGIGYTIKELFIRPGKSVRAFISHDRSRLVKPVIFVIVASLIYSTIAHFFHTEREMPAISSTVNLILTWIQSHYGYANIMMGVFMAFYLKLAFRKQGYNFFEILILLCFVIGMGMLIGAVVALTEGLAGIELSNVGTASSVLYCIWAIAQFFKGTFVNYIKSFFAYMAGLFTFTFLAVFLGILIDTLSK